jgi:hypothetical protein
MPIHPFHVVALVSLFLGLLRPFVPPHLVMQLLQGHVGQHLQLVAPVLAAAQVPRQPCL